MQSVFQIKCIKIQSKIKIKEKKNMIVNYQSKTDFFEWYWKVFKSMPQSIGISIILIIIIIIIIIIITIIIIGVE